MINLTILRNQSGGCVCPFYNAVLINDILRSPFRLASLAANKLTLSLRRYGTVQTGDHLGSSLCVPETISEPRWDSGRSFLRARRGSWVGTSTFEITSRPL
ncbi:hypothetical protein SCHPADRAFT_429659 [Schizopora paradoxa]|uniref:Uncharacterized protein n=1 Tax=Schizopora paradoxa TaxID=27342 RepID=A0A0H2RKW7_9AGAM|nr:hypothetical protein SCHPADRAFT_429659 [Schizopora paradoxa]